MRAPHMTSLRSAHGSNGRLSPAPRPATNPGKLEALCYVPDGLAPGAPLVVVLHGCTQDAAGYDRGAGWSQLAERHGFAVLLPEQTRANNANMCFNWFSPNHNQRGMGEAASIRAMVEAMRKTHGLDPARTFVTGLSAGGAMAGVMLAAYPDVFAGGAIIAGLPYGCASGMAQAFECMGGRAGADPAELVKSVRRASPHKGPWPRVSVWQGGADRTVVPGNADAIVAQWAGVHGLGDKPGRSDTIGGHPRRQWLEADGTVLVESVSITGMAHGTPLDPGSGEGQSGVAGAHMLDVGLSSTDRIAAFFGIAPEVAERPARRTAPAPRKRVVAAPMAPASLPLAASGGGGGVQQVIEDALRSAGLMR